MRLMRLLMCGGLLALPVTCAQTGDGTYTSAVQPSPAGRVNPAEPGYASGGGTAR